MTKMQSSRKSGQYGARELSVLCHQLAVYFKSGMSPLEGIPLVLEDMADKDMKSTLLSVNDQVLAGVSLSWAFRLTQKFPEYMVQMVEIGENTGMLDTVMENLSVYYETEADIRKKVKSAVTYPVVLALMMVGVIALLVIKVIPMFGEILQSFGGELSKEAQVLFHLAQGMKNAVLWIMGILLGVFLLVFLASRWGQGRRLYDRLKVINPFFGMLYKKITASRLAQGLSLTLQSGMDITHGFQSVIGLNPNTYVHEKLSVAYHAISQGRQFSEAFRETGLFPEMFVRMVRSGERSGQLDQIMQKLSLIYAKESEHSLKTFSNTIEPVLVTILSVVLGIVLLSVLLPMIGIMSSIG